MALRPHSAYEFYGDNMPDNNSPWGNKGGSGKKPGQNPWGSQGKPDKALKSFARAEEAREAAAETRIVRCKNLDL